MNRAALTLGFLSCIAVAFGIVLLVSELLRLTGAA